MSQQTAEGALLTAAGESGLPVGRTSNFICPHCHAFAQHQWGIVNSLSVNVDENARGGRGCIDPSIVLALCMACNHESIFQAGRLVFPRSVQAPPAVEDMPDGIREDFEEARQIASISPRGAAALLRLAIQKLCPILGAKPDDINSMIGQLVSEGKIPATLQMALDSVRVIGNEAVHPGTIDLQDDPTIAMSLFDIVNFIIERGISQPKQIEDIYSRLPQNKLKGIASRDRNAQPQHTAGGEVAAGED